ncbi:MAG: type II toxin-antitoxin system HicA family toxin [Spartobacteria bacterium]|nr:type II toxin-antitoxin system HicA family toxin [Spartobacteria bacterium]
MNNRQRKNLQAVFADPPSASISWAEIESMLQALGARLSEGRGSRVRIELNGRFAVFHRPHPRPTTDKGTLKSLRRFLENAGVHP